MNKLNKIRVDLFLERIYPLTVIADRYNGTYSGGKYLAFAEEYYNIPKEVNGDDITCCDFWSHFDGIVGKGDTVKEADFDLYEKFLKEVDNGYPHCEK